MPRLKAEDQLIKQERFHKSLRDPEFHALSKSKKAEYIGISEPTLGVWWNAISIDEWMEVKKTIERMNVKDEIEIDLNFTKRAKTGEPSSVELWKKLYRGWSPKSTQETISKSNHDGMSREEMEALAASKISVEALEKALAAKKKPLEVVEPKVENG